MNWLQVLFQAKEHYPDFTWSLTSLLMRSTRLRRSSRHFDDIPHLYMTYDLLSQKIFDSIRMALFLRFFVTSSSLYELVSSFWTNFSLSIVMIFCQGFFTRSPVSIFKIQNNENNLEAYNSLTNILPVVLDTCCIIGRNDDWGRSSPLYTTETGTSIIHLRTGVPL